MVEVYHFPSFSEGLSLRGECLIQQEKQGVVFPFLFRRAFIKGSRWRFFLVRFPISLPFRRGFH